MEEDTVGECELKEQIEILTTERNDLITRVEDLKDEMEMWKASYDDDIREARAEGVDDC
jgi:cell division protein FtsB